MATAPAPAHLPQLMWAAPDPHLPHFLAPASPPNPAQSRQGPVGPGEPDSASFHPSRIQVSSPRWEENVLGIYSALPLFQAPWPAIVLLLATQIGVGIRVPCRSWGTGGETSGLYTWFRVTGTVKGCLPHREVIQGIAAPSSPELAPRGLHPRVQVGRGQDDQSWEESLSTRQQSGLPSTIEVRMQQLFLGNARSALS